MKDDQVFDWEVDEVNNREDVIRLSLSILAALKLLIAALGYKFFTDELAVAIENFIPLLVILFGIWKNNYVSKRGKMQKAILQKHNLTDK